MTAERWEKFHILMMVVWAVMLIPSVLLWKESILFVIFVSLYANFSTHFSAWQAARAEEALGEAMIESNTTHSD